MQRAIAAILIWFWLSQILCAQMGGKAGIGGVAGLGASGKTSALTWTLIQHPSNFTCATTGTGSTQTLGCTITATSTTAGNTLILLAGASAGASVAPTFSSASGDSAWTHCPAEYVNISYEAATFNQTADCAYILSAAGGATSITFTWTATVPNGFGYHSSVELLEIHRASGSSTFDACTTGGACIATAAGTAARVGPTCPITGASDYVVQWIAETELISSISGPYTNPFDLDNSNVEAGFAGALNQAAAPAQIWTTSGDTGIDGAAMACLAFK